MCEGRAQGLSELYSDLSLCSQHHLDQVEMSLNING